MRARTNAPESPAPEAAYLEELEQERDFLLRSLGDLERERAAGDLDEPDFAVLRDGYTARAATVLRAIERARTGPATDAESDGRSGQAVRQPGPGASPPRDIGVRAARWLRSRLRPIIVTAAVGAVAVGAGLYVAGSAGDRLPGQTVTGSLPAGEADRLAQARDLLGKGKTLEAIQKYDQVLRIDPRQPEALAYRGWLLRLAGVAAGAPQLIDRGQQSVEAAIASDPNYPDAHFFRGVILLEDRNQPAAAVSELRLFLSTNPPPALRSAVEEVLNRALAASGQPPLTTTTTTPAAPAPSAPSSP